MSASFGVAEHKRINTVLQQLALELENEREDRVASLSPPLARLGLLEDDRNQLGLNVGDALRGVARANVELCELVSLFQDRLERQGEDVQVLRKRVVRLEEDRDSINQDFIVGAKRMLSGDFVLSLEADENVNATDLNAAAAGTFKKKFRAYLTAADGVSVLSPANWAPVLTEGKSVVDVDVGNPTIAGTPAFVDGACVIELTFDTDAGATKVYAAADTVTCQVQVNAGDSWMTIAVAAKTKTYTVV